jgi:hypothetical protein
MIDERPRAHGLSGDLGWNDTDEAPMGGLRSAILLMATSAYFGSVWLLSGLPPLASVASRVQGRSKIESDGESAHQSKWRTDQA